VVGKVAPLAESGEKIHGGNGISHREAGHRGGLDNVAQMSSYHKEASVALPRQFHRRGNVAGFQLHIGRKILTLTKLVNGLPGSLAGNLYNKWFVLQCM